MRKKVTIYSINGGRTIYKGYEDKDDNYFLELYKNDPFTKKIVRQYYPIKDNPKVVLWERKKVPQIKDGKCSKCRRKVVFTENEYEQTMKHATCPKCGCSWTICKTE